MLPTLHVRVGDTRLPARLAAAGSGCPRAAEGAGLPVGDAARRHRLRPFAVPPQRQLPLGGRARHGPAGHRRRGEADGDDRAGGEGRRRAGPADSRPPTRKELAETSVLALPLVEVSVRARTGGVSDDAGRLDLAALGRGAADAPDRPDRRRPDAGVGAAPPAYLPADRSPWHTAAPLRGEHVLLEQLAPSHVDGLLAALATTRCGSSCRTRARRRTTRWPPRRRGAAGAVAGRAGAVGAARPGDRRGDRHDHATTTSTRNAGRSASGTPSWAGRGGAAG